MPEDWTTFRQGNSMEALSIEARDPVLVSLLNGTANGTLTASALRGTLDCLPPDPEKVQAERIQREAQELFDKGKDHHLSLTEEMRLASIKPEALQLLKQQYEKQMASVDEINSRQRQQQLNEARLQSRNF